MSKKLLKISIGVVATIGAIFLFVVGFLFIISYILSIGSWEKISTDIDDYGKFRENAGIYERIFPEDLDEVKIVNQYIHLYDKNGSAGNQIFLDVIYEEELFIQKINYWKNYNSSYIESNYYYVVTHFQHSNIFSLIPT